MSTPHTTPGASTPIAPDLHPAPSRAFDGRPDAPMRCKGCGAYHGSIGAHIACLEGALHASREEAHTLRNDLTTAQARAAKLAAQIAPKVAP